MSSTLEPDTNPVDPLAEGDVADAPPEDPGTRRRRALRQSATDMVRSLLVIIAIVVVIVLAVPRPSSTPARNVNVESIARGVAPDLGFEPAVPRGLPTGWTATQADVRNSADGIRTWHIGYLTPDGHYASVEQAAKVTPRWEEIMTSGGTPLAAQTIDGSTWEQRYKDVRDVYSLIHRGPTRTTLITSKGGGLANAAVLARSVPATLR